MDTIEVKPIDVKQEEFNKQVDFFKVESRDLVVTNQEQHDEAIQWIREIEIFIRALEDRRKEITRPIDKAKQSVMDLFRTPVERAQMIADDIRQKVKVFKTKMELERIAEQRKIDEEIEKKAKKAEKLGKVEKAEEIRQSTPMAINRLENAPKSSEKKVWKFRIKDEALVPREFLTVDLDKVRKTIAVSEGDTNIAGIEVYFEMIPIIRR